MTEETKTTERRPGHECRLCRAATPTPTKYLKGWLVCDSCYADVTGRSERESLREAVEEALAERDSRIGEVDTKVDMAKAENDSAINGIKKRLDTVEAQSPEALERALSVTSTRLGRLFHLLSMWFPMMGQDLADRVQMGPEEEPAQNEMVAALQDNVAALDAGGAFNPALVEPTGKARRCGSCTGDCTYPAYHRPDCGDDHIGGTCWRWDGKTRGITDEESEPEILHPRIDLSGVPELFDPETKERALCWLGRGEEMKDWTCLLMATDGPVSDKWSLSRIIDTKEGRRILHSSPDIHNFQHVDAVKTIQSSPAIVSMIFLGAFGGMVAKVTPRGLGMEGE